MFDVMIATKDSAKTIDLTILYLRYLGVDPLIFLDSESDAETSTVLKQVNARYVVVERSGGGLSESMTRAVLTHVKTPWVLRLDDDELPNRAMISWIATYTATSPDKFSVGFTRRQLQLIQGKLMYATGGPFKNTWAKDYMTIVWKLFQPLRVTFTDKIHTPGYINENWLLAAPDCHIAHLEWITQTYDHRKAKMARYEAIKPGSAYYDMSLYERYPEEYYEYKPLEYASELDFITYQLAVRAGTLDNRRVCPCLNSGAS